RAALADGAAIPALATVVFDQSAALSTASIVNTFDLAAPISSVDPLSGQTTATTFAVSWSGSDGPGSGIATFDVFVSTDGGLFVPFVVGTTATSAPFAGAIGHTYGFYSIATDNLGHRQPTPTAAQAGTTITPTSTSIPPPTTPM